MADNDSPLEYPLPPANFTFLVESVLMQTQIRLGLLSFGEKDEKPNEPNFNKPWNSKFQNSRVQ